MSLKYRTQGFSRRLLQDQQVAGLDDDPLTRISQCPIQIHTDGDLATIRRTPNDGQGAGIGITDTLLDQPASKVTAAKGTVDQCSANLGDSLQDIQIVITRQSLFTRRQQAARIKVVFGPVLNVKRRPLS